MLGGSTKFEDWPSGGAANGSFKTPESEVKDIVDIVVCYNSNRRKWEGVFNDESKLQCLKEKVQHFVRFGACGGAKNKS